MLLLKGRFGPFEGVNPGKVGLEDCEGLRTHFKTVERIVEKYLVRHLLSAQRALGEGEFENVRSTENPADVLTRVRSDMVPLLRPLGSGRFSPGQLRPPKGVAWKE